MIRSSKLKLLGIQAARSIKSIQYSRPKLQHLSGTQYSGGYRGVQYYTHSDEWRCASLKPAEKFG